MGFVMIDRSIIEDPAFLSKPFCKLGFVTYLYSIAAFYPHDKWFGREKVHLEKGEIAISIRSLAAQVGWDKGRVKRFINELEKRGTLAPLTDAPVHHWRLRETKPEDVRCTGHAPTSAPDMHPQHNTRDLILNNKALKDPCEVSSATLPLPLKKRVRYVEEAQAVFDHWKMTWNSPRSIFDDKRKKIVKTALKAGHSVNDLKEAIEGMHNCPHNLGENDRGVVFNRIGIVLKDAESIDRFRQMYEVPPIPNSGGKTVDQGRAEAMAQAERILNSDMLNNRGAIYENVEQLEHEAE